MTIQQVVRDILERAIEDGLASPMPQELREEWEPQQFSAEELAGCTGVLAEWLRQRGAEAAAEGRRP
jgi:methyl coenzyme M reductase beta subunit